MNDPIDKKQQVALSRSAAERTRETVLRSERGYRTPKSDRADSRRSLLCYACFAMTPDGGIPKASDQFHPGSAVCEIYDFDLDTSTIVDGGRADTVFNQATGGPTPGNKIVGIIWRGSAAFVDVDYC